MTRCVDCVLICLCDFALLDGDLIMASEKALFTFDSTEKAFLQAAIDLKIAQVKRSSWFRYV